MYHIWISRHGDRLVESGARHGDRELEASNVAIFFQGLGQNGYEIANASIARHTARAHAYCSHVRKMKMNVARTPCMRASCSQHGLLRVSQMCNTHFSISESGIFII